MGSEFEDIVGGEVDSSVVGHDGVGGYGVPDLVGGKRKGKKSRKLSKKNRKGKKSSRYHKRVVHKRKPKTRRVLRRKR